MDQKYTIGYIDENQTEVNTYTRKLRPFGFNVIGYEFKKGMSVNELMDQVKNSKIDLLMIDFKLKGTKVTFDGNEVENLFYDIKPLFPHIIFTSRKDDAEHFVEDWKIIFEKEEVFSDKASTQKFAKMLEKSIEQYRNHFNKKKEIIAHLIEKSEKSKLNLSEIETLLKTKKELQVLDSSLNYDFPEYLLLPKNIEEIDNLKNEAAEYLEELINRTKK